MTSQQAANLWQRRARVAEREFMAATRQIAAEALAFVRTRLQQTVYAVPEDVNPTTGKKLWTRTSALLNQENVLVRDAYTAIVRNPMIYAKARHEAGKPGGRRINPRRISHWHDDLRREFHDRLYLAYQHALRMIARSS